jgi:hypothetical protein
MIARCEKCDLPIEPEDLVEEESDDPLSPIHYHLWCHPDFTSKFPSGLLSTADVDE